jgi:cyclopropane-fatty-acyl-phospholipid synthase
MSGAATLSKLTRRHRDYAATHPAHSFAVRLTNGTVARFGDSEPAFTIIIVDERGERTLASFDQFQIAVAYLEGHLDIDGDLQCALSMRSLFRDFHPIAWMSRYVPRLVGAGMRQDRRSISAHYDRDPEFFRTFLDTRHRCYTQGSFSTDDEPLEPAISRKLELALESLHVRPGDHVLDIGGGWGAFAEYAGKRGIQVTSLTLSQESESYLSALIDRERLPATVVRQHFLRYSTNQQFDAIVNMGTTEHLPNYRATLQKYHQLLRPGGYVYLDALAMRSKVRLSTFMTRYLYPGGSAPLLLHEYLAKVAQSPFALIDLHDERHNYYLTCRAWAHRLDAAADEIRRRWGESLYRHFRLFLWGSASAFDTGQVQAYRWVLHLPA